jgi:sugar lactone lactonase YvrE
MPADAEEPFLRGLAVDAKGTVYVAATGCRSVLKITPDGKVSTVLKADRPWSPSGVAVHHEDVYVLEHISMNSDAHEDWPPRVRKLGRDGKITILATVSRGGGGC